MPTSTTSSHAKQQFERILIWADAPARDDLGDPMTQTTNIQQRADAANLLKLATSWLIVVSTERARDVGWRSVAHLDKN